MSSENAMQERGAAEPRYYPFVDRIALALGAIGLLLALGVAVAMLISVGISATRWYRGFLPELVAVYLGAISVPLVLAAVVLVAILGREDG